MVTNIAVVVDGDRATAAAYLLVLISQDGSHRTLPPGRYDCALVKEADTWRFSSRTVFHDHEYTLDGIGR
jgi:ketosteroid isomerase-like protein